MPLYPPPSSNLAIGAAITSGTAGRMLYEGAGPVLADSSLATANLVLSGLTSPAASWGAAPANQDMTFGAGRLLIDARQAGDLNISHAALTANGSQALRVPSTGATRLNAPAGQNITLSIGNSGHWFLDGTTFALTPGVNNSKDVGATATAIRRLYQAEYVEISEMAAPGTPPAAKARQYLKDNAGKQNLVIKWDDGVETLIAAQP